MVNLWSNPEHENYFNGDLSRLTKLIMAAIICFGLILLGIIAYAGWSSNKIATEREKTLLENALNHRIARVLNEQKSVAWWDDAVTKITDKTIDLDFADSEFGIFLTETYGQDEIYILDGEDRPVYSYFGAKRHEPSSFEPRRPVVGAVVAETRDGRHSNLRTRPDTFSESQSNYRVLAGAQPIAHWAGHIVSVEGHPAVVAALTILPNVNMELLTGTPNLLVSVKYINEGFISEIGRSLLLNDLVMAPETTQRNGAVSEPFVGDDGIRVGYLSWTTRRPGQVLLTIILPLVAFAIFGTSVLAKNMLKRLKQTSEQLTQREAQARFEAKHDSLSGLPNRVHMVENIDNFLHHRKSKHGSQRAVAAYIDIDRFKDINDTLGHEAGDQLIKAVGQRLKARLRPEDFLSRFGGDEFAVLGLPMAVGGEAAIAERVAQAFTLPFSIQGQSIRVTASVGLAVAPDNGLTADELMRHADIALYEAKNQGRDRAVLFSIEMAEKVEHRRLIEVELRAAIEANQLRLHYQPIISCLTGEIVGVEALLRWCHPVYGEMSPIDFISIAENSGLLPILGEWVLDRAMQDSKRWPDLEVAVNLSPVQFRHVDLGKTLRELATKNGIQPKRFVLEITEGVLLEATAHTNAILEAIRESGFKIALDDFGTQYSSLAYLCNFKFDKIKIDRSFVSKISKVDTSRTIVQSVVKLGRALSMGIVAEGVETEFEAVMMTNFGCTELQGFYFSKAMSADDMVELLSTFQPKHLASGPKRVHAVKMPGATG